MPREVKVWIGDEVFLLCEEEEVARAQALSEEILEIVQFHNFIVEGRKGEYDFKIDPSKLVPI